MSKLTVIQSKANQKGGFVTKMSGEISVNDEIFGTKKSKITYYISGTNQLKEGTEIPFAALFPRYKVEEHPFVNEETGEVIQLKWLHLNATQVIKSSLATA